MAVVFISEQFWSQIIIDGLIAALSHSF